MYAGKAARLPQPSRAKQPAHPAKRPLQASPRVAHDAAPGRVGNHAMGQLLRLRGVQAKLTVTDSHDPLEREADRVADSVTRVPAAPSQPVIGRKCAECEREDVQRKASVPIGAEVSGSLEENVRSLKGGGQPLPAEVQRDLQPRLRANLSEVRVHTSQQAGKTARALNARAYTVGSDIAFAPGEYAPQTTSGRWLLAHELTHVVQQGGGAAVQRDVLENVEDVLNPSALLGRQWLGLDKKTKLRFVDKAIDLALAAIDKFPGRVLMGGIWEFVQEGLIGFYAKLKTADAEVKVNAVDKLVKIQSGKDEAFTLAYLKGLAKGFVIDGALGIFIAVWDLIKGLGKLWDFFKGIADATGGFPEEIETLLKGFVEEGQSLLANVGPAIEQLRNLATDPKQTNALIATIVEKGKGLAKEAGGKIAESLLGFFSKPEASAEIGETVGGLTGQVLWEVVFAALTAGGGAAVTAAKTALREAAAVLSKLLGRVVTGVLKVVSEIRAAFGRAVGWIKGAFAALKGKLSEVGGRFAKLVENVEEFLAKLLRNCHESKISCKWPKHHPWPQYLGGLREQTLKKLPRRLHELFHVALDKWKGGKYARARGAEFYKNLDPKMVIKDLREFYQTAEGGAFAEYLPDFEKAVKETLAAME
jgi:hypothetical protein